MVPLPYRPEGVVSVDNTTCQTISCGMDATHELTWPGWDARPVTERVCEPCGEEYASRPSLKAELKPLA
jgi:hypothetical protein